jgi:hypothetical protein
VHGRDDVGLGCCQASEAAFSPIHRGNLAGIVLEPSFATTSPEHLSSIAKLYEELYFVFPFPHLMEKYLPSSAWLCMSSSDLSVRHYKPDILTTHAFFMLGR